MEKKSDASGVVNMSKDKCICDTWLRSEVMDHLECPICKKDASGAVGGWMSEIRNDLESSLKCHLFCQTWPPIGMAILIYGIGRWKIPNEIYNENECNYKQGYFLVFWIIENNRIVWKDCHHKRELYNCEPSKWWQLEL